MVSDSYDSCRILYSTQSGRAKACARRAARILRECTSVQLENLAGSTFDHDIRDISEFAFSLRKSGAFLVMFVSTTGDGEHTDTIQRTWRQLLQKSLPENLFEGISFAIFSLGDRAYGPQFCAAGRKLAVRLLQLGAKVICEPGYGDDGTPNGGVFADLDVWIEDTLLSTLGKEQSEGPILSTPTSRPYSVTVLSQPIERNLSFEEWQDDSFSETYQAFFKELCPITAYKYDSSLRRQHSSGTSTHCEPLIGHVTVNKRLTASDWEQDTRHIRINISTSDRDPNGQTYTWDQTSLPYRAGDVAAVIPSNSEEEVKRFLQVLPSHVADTADCELQIEHDAACTDLFGAGCSFWPSRCTLRSWLTYCADIHALPEREDLRALSLLCSEEHEMGTDQRDKLVSLSETTGAALYADYVLREKRSWADVLYDFDSLRASGSKLTLECIFALLSPIRPREFSIASSPTHEYLSRQNTDGVSEAGFSIELCVAVVEGTTPLGRSFHGLCSHYLSQTLDEKSGARNGSVLRLWVRPGTFEGLPLEMPMSSSRANSSFEVPVLYVGAGTGIAPLRGLILERQAVRFLSKKGCATGISDMSATFETDREDVLVFGCRKEKADFYYRVDWEVLRKDGRLGLLTAFSRDQWHKIYVQQAIQKADKESNFIVRHILEKNGAVYIAGGPKMARAVKQELVESLAEAMDGNEKQALHLLSSLQRMGRFSIEAWS